MHLSLSDVLAGGEDSTFQQLAQGGDLLEGLEFPDTLSQLPKTPERQGAGTRGHLEMEVPPPTGVSSIAVCTMYMFFCCMPLSNEHR